MIDGFRPRRRAPGLRPVDKHLASKVVVGDHSRDIRPQFRRPSSTPTPSPTPPPQQSAQLPSIAETMEQEAPMTSAVGGLPPEALRAPSQKVTFFEKLRNLDKKQWLIIIGIFILLVGGGVAAFVLTRPEKVQTPQASTAKPTPKPAPKPTTVASTLTGLQVEPAVNERPTTGVMIENSLDARPQSGLDEAGVVFEAVAEGGITRFLAVYQDKTAPYLGPVRSVRPYYIQWAMGFDAAIAHAGGSAEALRNIRDWKAKDLDQFANAGAYERISSRFAPHNLYTSIAQLNELESKKGFGKANYTGFVRKPESPSKTPDAKVIDLNISSYYFNVHYAYDPGSNSYKRFQADEPHNQIDKNGATSQLQPKVVVALVMGQGKSSDVHTSYATIGSGKMFVFQDGVMNEGTWKKNSNAEQFTFTNNSGQPLALNPGQTWITVVGDTSRVTYGP